MAEKYEYRVPFTHRPPRHLGDATIEAGSSVTSLPLFTSTELYYHFVPSNTSGDASKTVNISNFDQKVLNNSSLSLNDVAFVVLNGTASALWENKRSIVSKTNLHLLPKYKEKKAFRTATAGEWDFIDEPTDVTDKATDKSRSIAVFKQVDPALNRGYRFEGWFKIQNYVMVGANSTDLIQMLLPRGLITQDDLDSAWANITMIRDAEQRQDIVISRIS